MPVTSVTSSVKAALILAIVSGAAWVSALAYRLPGVWLGEGVSGLAPSAAEVLGRLDAGVASPGAEVCSVAVSPDGRWLATGTRDGTVRLWEAAGLWEVGGWSAHDEQVTALAFFPGSHDLLTAGAEGTITRWSLGGTAARRWPSAALVTALAVAPDGRTVAVATGDRLKFLDAERSDPVGEGEVCSAHPSVRALAFTPDARTLATGGGGDNAVRVWAIDGGRPVLRFTLHNPSDHGVRGLAYSDDGSTLVSLDTAGLALAWDCAGKVLGATTAGESVCLRGSVGCGGRLFLTAGVGARTARLARLRDGWWN